MTFEVLPFVENSDESVEKILRYTQLWPEALTVHKKVQSTD